MRLLLISALLLIGNIVYSQNLDYDLIRSKNETEIKTHYHVSYLFKDSKPFIKYNPITFLPGVLFFSYQKIVSPQIFADCLFDVSCSHFSGLAINRYGLIKGVFLTADRLTRCTQFGGQDISLVRINPETNKAVDEIDWYKKNK